MNGTTKTFVLLVINSFDFGTVLKKKKKKENKTHSSLDKGGIKSFPICPKRSSFSITDDLVLIAERIAYKIN